MCPGGPWHSSNAAQFEVEGVDALCNVDRQGEGDRRITQQPIARAD